MTTPLMLAAMDGDHKKIKELLESGVQVDEVDEETGHTALFVALLMGIKPVYRPLQFGASLENQDKWAMFLRSEHWFNMMFDAALPGRPHPGFISEPGGHCEENLRCASL